MVLDTPNEEFVSFMFVHLAYRSDENFELRSRVENEGYEQRVDGRVVQGGHEKAQSLDRVYDLVGWRFRCIERNPH